MLNVLNLAMPVVSQIHPNEAITCRKLVSYSRNSMGVVQPVWNTFVAVGQIQPQTADDVANQMNLDVSEVRMNVWIKAELHTVDMQDVADQVVYRDRVWNVTTVTNWNKGNGWGNYVITLDKYVEPGESGGSGESESGDGGLNGDGLVW